MILHLEFSVTEQDAGGRLDRFLASRFGALSRMRISNMITFGACMVNNVPAGSGFRLSVGDQVAVTLDEAPPGAMIPERSRLDIVYEDDHLLVVNKPAGILVHPTRTVKTGTLSNALVYHLNRGFYDRSGLTDCGPKRIASLPLDPPAHGEEHSLVRPGLVHRLDKATSGLLVVAKTQRALSTLSRHFHKRLIEKRYVALVAGEWVNAEGVVSAPIGRREDQQPHWWVTEGGRAAETRFRILERLDGASLVELEPVSGRTNQLRIHMAYAGHPILGDDCYSEIGLARAGRDSRPNPRAAESVSVPKHGRHHQALGSLITGEKIPLCLHARRLAFHHPADGRWIEFESDLPGEMVDLLDHLRGVTSLTRGHRRG